MFVDATERNVDPPSKERSLRSSLTSYFALLPAKAQISSCTHPIASVFQLTSSPSTQLSQGGWYDVAPQKSSGVGLPTADDGGREGTGGDGPGGGAPGKGEGRALEEHSPGGMEGRGGREQVD